MRTAIIGATGHAGTALVHEAERRGREVTGFVRHPERAVVLGDNTNARIVKADAFTLTAPVLTRFDVVIDAFSTSPDHAYLHVDLATHLIAQLRNITTTRVAFILGAGSLQHPDGGTVLSKMEQNPELAGIINTPRQQAAELDFLRHVSNVNWVGISPSMTFAPGPATDYVAGKDTLLVDTQGRSHLTSGNLALALMDEIEQPRHTQERFTARDAE
ncbi:NAD(P)H-binding protein [Lacticaseibacillus pantheris]|uniref:NAD(P)H-binding protein n=1 Tax=Lacticaseibacillus pantheris TaxID=171523 RepID=UPI00265A14DF|nr:NAD(P)H-binding protein [Lacticaseibacillus pantheris]WKF84720.1 NAD(P)H-binding protein [Lacticaseibacillus pantheris]